jgi:hypothetical protein
MEQSRWKSPVLKGGLAMLLVYAVKEFTGYELPNEQAENFFTVLFIVIMAIAEINNPKDKNKI